MLALEQQSFEPSNFHKLNEYHSLLFVRVAVGARGCSFMLEALIIGLYSVSAD